MAEITLNGAGYSIAPGTYKRAGDGFDGATSGTWSQKDFFGGQLRTIQLERDRGYSGLAVGPNIGGMGVEPWPFKDTFTDGGLAAAGTVRQPSIVAGNNCYVAIGRFLYQSVTLGSPAWGAWTQRYDAGSGKTITHLAQVGAKVVMCIAGADMQAFDTGTNTTAAYLAGEQGWRAVGYAGGLVWAAAGDRRVLKAQLSGSTLQTWTLDAPIEMIALHAGKVVIATKGNLYTLGGNPIQRDLNGDGVLEWLWSEDPEPLYTPGVWTDDEDYQFVLSFGGRLYTWVGNQVMEYQPTGDRQGWRAAGLEGRSCNGATVAGSWLIVAIVARNGDSEVWAFDGSGWWIIDRSSNQARVWPTYTGGAGNIDLVLFRDGSGSGLHDIIRLVYRTNALHSFKTGSSNYVSSMLHVDHPECDKSWRRIGAAWAVPDRRGNDTSVTPVTIGIDYSIDGGRTWWTGTTNAITDPMQRVSTVEVDLGAQQLESRYLMLRATWSGVSDWAPVLACFWADWQLVGVPVRRMRWMMTISARDRMTNPDGSTDPRTGAELATDLWDAWRAPGTIDLIDLDEATYRVQIVSIEESLPKTSEEKVFHSSAIKLTLVEA